MLFKHFDRKVKSRVGVRWLLRTAFNHLAYRILKSLNPCIASRLSGNRWSKTQPQILKGIFSPIEELSQKPLHGSTDKTLGFQALMLATSRAQKQIILVFPAIPFSGIG